MDRFISGFSNKCCQENKVLFYWTFSRETCLDCKNNLTCFVGKLHTALEKYLQNDFSNVHIIHHFFPQSLSKTRLLLSKHCLKCRRNLQIDKKYIEIVEMSIRNIGTYHETKRSPIRKQIQEEILHNEYILKHLISMFYMDYVVFNITIPDYVKNFLTTRNIL
uniref:Uncharacterized protein n=1 Tax=Syphacia muris TaxID=451379 RepID=A0A0N5B029_9BILA